MQTPPPPAPHRTPRGSGLGRQASSGGGGAVGACVDAMPPWPVQRAVQWGPWTDLGAMGSCIPGDPWSPGGKLTPPAAAALCTSRLQQQNCPCSAKHAPTIFGRPSRQTAPGTRGSSRAGLPLGSCTYLGTSATMRVTPPAPPDAHAPPGSGRARASHPAGGGGGGSECEASPSLATQGARQVGKAKLSPPLVWQRAPARNNRPLRPPEQCARPVPARGPVAA